MRDKDELKIFETLKEAYKTTTENNNRFLAALNSVEWDRTFQAFGHTFFVKGGFRVVVENTNPFKQKWGPTVIFSDKRAERYMKNRQSL